MKILSYFLGIMTALILLGIIGVVGVYTGHVQTTWLNQNEVSVKLSANPSENDGEEVFEFKEEIKVVETIPEVISEIIPEVIPETVPEIIPETIAPLPEPDLRYKNFVDMEVAELLVAFNEYLDPKNREGEIVMYNTRWSFIEFDTYIQQSKDSKLKEIFASLWKVNTKHKSLSKEDAHGIFNHQN